MLQQTSDLVEKQLPGFVREECPKFINFLKYYYLFIELPTDDGTGNTSPTE